MSSIIVDVSGVDKLSRLLAAYPAEVDRAMNEAGEQSAGELLKVSGVQNYPAPQYPRPAMPMTDKQRRYFFWALKNGLIEVPYQRGGTRSERYGSKFYKRQEGYTTVIGNNASYAKYLGGGQSAYMQNLGWRKLADVLQEMQPRITDIFKEKISAAKKRAGL